jgi:hypothetical protein
LPVTLSIGERVKMNTKKLIQKTEQEIVNEVQKTLDYNFRNEVQINQESVVDYTYYIVEFDGSKMAEFDNEESAKHFVELVEWRVEKLFDRRFQPKYWNSQKCEWIDWGEAYPAKYL